MKRILLLSMAMLLVGCAATPAPEPPTLAPGIYCTAQTGMTHAEPEPLRPQGDYTQLQVAGYLIELHRWGWRGWKKLESVRNHAERCASNATATPNEDD